MEQDLDDIVENMVEVTERNLVHQFKGDLAFFEEPRGPFVRYFLSDGDRRDDVIFYGLISGEECGWADSTGCLTLNDEVCQFLDAFSKGLVRRYR